MGFMAKSMLWDVIAWVKSLIGLFGSILMLYEGPEGFKDT
jgi:hypothetical protein